MRRCARGGFRPIESAAAVKNCNLFQLELKKWTRAGTRTRTVRTRTVRTRMVMTMTVRTAGHKA